MKPTERAESATVHSVLNCYLRETGPYPVVSARDLPADPDADRAIRVELRARDREVFAPLAYYSPTDGHRFELPVLSRRPDGTVSALSYVELLSLLVGELRRSRARPGPADDLVAQVIESKRAIERFVDERRDDTDELYDPESTFLEAEQSLVFGHSLHPTPKSRRGISPHDRPRYAPELRGSFPLHYFGADASIVRQESATDRDAASWIVAALRDDETVDDDRVDDLVASHDVLVPVHPWQADYLRTRPHVRDHLGSDLEYLGPVGRPYHPTSSVRTLYSPDSPFMVKGSLNVRITNSTRVNKRRELSRGVAVAELLETELGDELAERFPSFGIVRDPAYVTLTLGDGDESGFETILRTNPFRGAETVNATPVVGLCQPHLDGGATRLRNVIERLAEREGRSTAEVSEEWFRRYLEIGLRPVFWLYLRWGLGLEAHQQNCVLVLEDCYPGRVLYRDNQGFFFARSRYDEVDALLPGVGARAETVRPDDLTDEAIVYYVVINNLFGLINAFGAAGLADERRLLALVRDELTALGRYDRPSSTLLSELLTAETLTCKANLLMRFHDVDELTGDVEDQIVTTEIDNPLVEPGREIR